MSTKPEVRAEAASEGQIEERLQTLAEMVVYGASRHEVMQFAEKLWRVSRRTAQEYLKKVQERLVRDPVAQAGQDRLFYLKLSQMQRDKLVGLALRYAHDNREQLEPRIMQSLASLITAVRGLLDSRDRAAGEIHQHVAEQLREAEALVASKTGPEPSAAEPSEEPKVVSEPQPTVVNGNGRHDGADRATPLSGALPSRSDPTDWPRPKPKGHNRMEPIEDKPDVVSPDCADCAGPPVEEEVLVAAR